MKFEDFLWHTRGTIDVVCILPYKIGKGWKYDDLYHFISNFVSILRAEKMEIKTIPFCAMM